MDEKLNERFSKTILELISLEVTSDSSVQRKLLSISLLIEIYKILEDV